ncbi:histidine kinase [Acidothermaceae bacterium B102]|nr:histidine kinase [Acidothermaceae bacterium B102]
MRPPRLCLEAEAIGFPDGYAEPMPVLSEPRPPLLQRLRPRQWLLVDVTLCLLYGTLSAAVMASRTRSAWLVVAVAGLSLVSVLLTRTRPVISLGLALTLAGLAPLDTEIAFIALFPVGCALAACAARLPRRLGWTALAAGLTAPVATALPDFAHSGAIVPFGLVLVTCWMVGIALGAQRRYSESMARRQEERASAAATEERLRIARELHDIVAHSMSVITVQAGFAHLVIGDRPREAAAALGAIESTGRDVLVEMRRLLGMLREDGTAELTPAARLDELESLVALTSRAGVEVTLRLTGRRPELPAGLELTAYRIVQEALTNVVRHAAAAHAEVSISFTETELRISVTDDGRGPHPSATGGHGLAGMRERVHLCGGELVTGTRESGGFAVLATMPLRAFVSADSR